MKNNSSDSRRHGVNQRRNRKTHSRNIHGDVLKKKKVRSNVRIIFQNVNGFGVTDPEVKRDLIKEFINKYSIDIYAMAEVNVNWKIVAKKESLRELCNEWFSLSRTCVAHNHIAHTSKPHQQGGVGIITSGELSLHVDRTEGDIKSLGRWCSTLFQGKHGVKTRIVSVYVPCDNSTHGNKTVWSQQQESLLKLKTTKNVRDTFWSDLWTCIDKWSSDGEQLIIGGDWNENVYNQTLIDNFQDKSLFPVITKQHQQMAPETYNGGSRPIDEFFASPSLKISACGYLEHGRVNSDHRPIWVEIHKDSFLGNDPPPLSTHKARRLKVQDPRTVAKYNFLLEQEFEKHRIYERSLNLYNTFQTPLTPEQCAEFDAIDRQREKSMKYAEKHCRKLHMGAIPWSPVIQHIRTIILYVKLTIRKKKRRKVSSKYLTRLSKKIGFTFENFSMEELEFELDQANKLYKKEKKNAKKYRQDFLVYLAEALHLQGKGEISTIVSTLKRIEEQRQTYKRLAPLRKRFCENLNTTSVIKTLSSGNTLEITEKVAMENAIIEENKEKYHQSENSCPFLNEPLRTAFGEYGETNATEEVLGGYFDQSGCNTFTSMYLDSCQTSNTTTNTCRSPAEFKNSWKKMKEKTGTHDLHFGHFQAACEHDHNLLVHYILAEIPFRTGFSPSRWKVATNVMILKKAGMFNIEKLRTLCLFQSDFNHNNKFLGKTLMEHSVKNGLIAKEQYSVTGKKSISHALNKNLLFDITRYQKASLCLTSCDLKSCYDRIVHTPTMLAARSCGMPKEPLACFFATLQEVQYYTRTVYGVSDTSFGGYESNFTNKPQGTGQGNGAAPQLWAVISSKMFSVLHKAGLASVIQSPISGVDLWLVGFAYVDDSDLFTFSKTHDVHQTVQKMQILVDAWESTAKVTGGAIAPLKCWWYLIEFTWDEAGEWSYKNHTDNNIYKLEAVDENEKLQCLRYLPPDTSQEMLGVFLTPDGNNREQVKQLKLRASSIAELIRTKHVYRHEAWLALTTMAIKSIEYCLPATTLSYEECKEIMWIMIKDFLPKSGVNRYIKRDVLYALTGSQGLGLKDIYLTQGISHVNEIIEHVWKKSITGQFICTSLEYLRLELGCNCDILSSDHNKYKSLILTHSWLEHTWAFMTEQSISIDITTPTIPTVRDKDTPIMEAILANKTLTANDILFCNKCRIYLRVFLVSDITTGSGKYIRSSVWEGNRTSHNSNKALTWPEWQRPPKKMWDVWQAALRKTFCRNKHMQLDIPLGCWNYIPPYWNWFVSGNDLMYRDNDTGKVYKHNFIAGSNRRKKYSLIERMWVVENDTELIPTTIQEQGCIITPEGNDHVKHDKIPPLPTTKMYKQWLFSSITQQIDYQLLIKNITTHEAIAVSDGSFFETYGVGAAAWTIVTSSYKHIISGSSISPGDNKIQSSFRSEMVGILAIIDLINSVCLDFNITDGTLTIYCDSKSVISVMNNWMTVKMTPKHKNADIISAALKLRDAIPIDIHFKGVFGHQDRMTSRHNLDPIAKLNVEVDEKAKNLAIDIINNNVKYDQHHQHPLSFSTCRWNQVTILQQLSNDLYKHITHNNMHIYWCENGRVKQDQLYLLDSTAMEKGSTTMSLTMKRFVAKWSCECIATGKNMERWQQRHTGACPYCLTPLENTQHILRCTHEDSIQTWETALLNFLYKLHYLDTCPKLIIALKNELHSWRHNQQTPTLQHIPQMLRKVIISQRSIGWQQFLEGLISTTWAEYMESFYRKSHSMKTGITWASRLYHLTWNVVHHIWEARNNQLHETERIDDFEGAQILKQAIIEEWNKGIGRLPASEFSRLFKSNLNTLLQKNLDSQKHWLTIIRQGRILLDPNNVPQDQFQTSKALQKWLGISYKVTNSEALPILKTAITTEWTKGLSTLPKQQYQQYFSHTLHKLLQSTTDNLKNWLIHIRKGRTRYDSTNVINDEFNYPGAIRDWLEN